MRKIKSGLVKKRVLVGMALSIALLPFSADAGIITSVDEKWPQANNWMLNKVSAKLDTELAPVRDLIETSVENVVINFLSGLSDNLFGYENVSIGVKNDIAGQLVDVISLAPYLNVTKFVANMFFTPAPNTKTEVMVATDIILQSISDVQDRMLLDSATYYTAGQMAKYITATQEYRSMLVTTVDDDVNHLTDFSPLTGYMTNANEPINAFDQVVFYDPKRFVERLHFMTTATSFLQQIETEYVRLDAIKNRVQDPSQLTAMLKAKLSPRVGTFIGLLAKYDTPIASDAAKRNLWRLSHEARFSTPIVSDYIPLLSRDGDYVAAEIERYFGVKVVRPAGYNLADAQKASRAYSYTIDGTSYNGTILSFGLQWHKWDWDYQNTYTVLLDTYGDVVYKSSGSTSRSTSAPQPLTLQIGACPCDVLAKKGVQSHLDKTYPLYIRDGYGPVRRALDVWAGNAGVVNRQRFSVDTVYEEYNIQIDSDGDGLNNWTEKDLGSNIYVKDSDGDGMEDGFAHKYGFPVIGNVNATSPQCVAPSNLYVKGVGPGNDMDCDGLTNQQESKYRTNPLKLDSDGDGMNDGEEVAKGRDPAVNVPAIMVIVQQLLLN